ncbi:Segregation and condensation protein A [bioreactor metagenome]|uniref:Segregation and condensation protein A n=1 Tax=bioreactor metagenome TaxID=1076179 RepID=A0A645BT63_9ZZZZ
MDGPIYHLEGVVKAKSQAMEDFVGPLDLILHLLSKNKMEIKDIQISILLSQYLEWMNRRKSMDLEVASEFVNMASHLIYIKTRMLLSLNDAEALSEMEQLIATLEAHRCHENYARVKSVLGLLEGRHTVGRDYLVKTPEPPGGDKNSRYSHKPEDLRRAMGLILERAGSRLPPKAEVFHGIVGREPYPVADKARELLERLLRMGVARFRLLFRGDRSRSEIVATFLAVLELCRARRLSVAGEPEDCTVTCTEDGEGELTLDSYQAAGPAI